MMECKPVASIRWNRMESAVQKRWKARLKYSNFRYYSWNYLWNENLGTITESTSAACTFRVEHEDADSRFPQNVGTCLTKYTMSHPKKTFLFSKTSYCTRNRAPAFDPLSRQNYNVSRRCNSMMMTAAILMNWKAAQLDVIAYSCWATSEDITFQHTVVHETPAAYIYL